MIRLRAGQCLLTMLLCCLTLLAAAQITDPSEGGFAYVITFLFLEDCNFSCISFSFSTYHNQITGSMVLLILL